MVALLGMAGLVWAQDIQLPVQSHVLSNGLKVLVLERHEVPRIACRLAFRVGGSYDPQGRTGLAHLMEHMAFRGTKNIGTKDWPAEERVMAKIETLMAEIIALEGQGDAASKARLAKLREQLKQANERQKLLGKENELWELYNTAGATGMNAYTSRDHTMYVVNVPANKLELYMWLESDRVANSVMRGFYTEREVVRDERRRSVDANPAGHYNEELNAVFYTAHPYRRPIVGWDSDLAKLTSADAAAFHSTWYVPQNAVMCLVGDVKAAEAFKLAEQYFGRIPRSAKPLRVPPMDEPEQHGERRVVAEVASRPSVRIMFHAPKFLEADSYAMDVAAMVLNGDSGRLYRKLVVEKGVALSAGAYSDNSPTAGAFGLSAEPKPGRTHQEVEEALVAEVEGLVTNPPTAQELARARNSYLADLVGGLESSDGLADALATYECFGDWHHLLTEPKKSVAVTAEDVARVIGKYLTVENRTVGWLKEKPAESRAPQGGDAQ